MIFGGGLGPHWREEAKFYIRIYREKSVKILLLKTNQLEKLELVKATSDSVELKVSKSRSLWVGLSYKGVWGVKVLHRYLFRKIFLKSYLWGSNFTKKSLKLFSKTPML